MAGGGAEQPEQQDVDHPGGIQGLHPRQVDKRGQHNGDGDHLVQHQPVARLPGEQVLLQQVAQGEQQRRADPEQHPEGHRALQVGEPRADHDPQADQHRQPGQHVDQRESAAREERFEQDGDDREGEHGQHADRHRRDLHGMEKAHPVQAEQQSEAVDPDRGADPAEPETAPAGGHDCGQPSGPDQRAQLDDGGRLQRDDLGEQPGQREQED